jgi:hypothetical protein
MDLVSLLTRVATGLAIAVGATACLAAGGGALNDPQETYSTERIGPERAATPDPGVNASVTVQFVSYALNSVGGKYRLIPLLLRIGPRPAPLTLAIDQDRLVVLAGGKKIPASFQLSALDRPLWDSLSPETKKRLTYPEQLSPNSAAVVYAFVPLADLPGPPDGFELTIKSLAAPLTLLPEPKKAAASLAGDGVTG